MNPGYTGIESDAEVTTSLGNVYSANVSEWMSVEELLEGAEQVGGMLVRSEQLRRVMRTIKRLGPHKATVLIQGESGTGKELVARALHAMGQVPNGPFVTFNCSNLVESLAEAQLFGHVRGAFTDAREDSLGYFRSANGGTLFLDEIGELPLKLQPKLLRAVETHEVQPVGSAHSYKVNIRLVAATNRDLRAMVREGQFRDDLYYRLNAAAILIPPLRERIDAVPAFVGHFIEHYSRMFGKPVHYVSRRALQALCAHTWPGNVRELAHAVESAVLLTDSDRISINELPDAMTGPDRLTVNSASVGTSAGGEGDSTHERNGESGNRELLLDEVIRKTLLRSLEETEGNRRRAADLLGVSRSTLYRMLSRYGLADWGRRRNAFLNSMADAQLASPGSSDKWK